MNNVSEIFRINNTLQPAAGRVIISEPLSMDSFFGRSVVLINEHNENGTVGFILNKSSRLTVGHFFDTFKNHTIPIYMGGPVATDTLHFIHRSKGIISNSVQVTKDIYWGGDLDDLSEKMNNNELLIKDTKFFIGYAGWEQGQLETEIKNNFWVVSNIETKQILRRTVKDFWANAVEKAGEEYKFWLNIPEDIVSN